MNKKYYEAKEYTIIIKYGYVDGQNQYIGTAKEFTDILEFASTPIHVYGAVCDTIETLIEMAVAEGHTLPKPNLWIV